jgi:hypothetical protein
MSLSGELVVCRCRLAQDWHCVQHLFAGLMDERALEASGQFDSAADQFDAILRQQAKDRRNLLSDGEVSDTQPSSNESEPPRLPAPKTPQ